MKKLLASALALLIVFSFSSCALTSALLFSSLQEDDDKDNNSYDYDFDFNNDDNEAIDKLEIDNSSYTAIMLKNGYDNLENNAQKTIYKDIYNYVYKIEDIKTSDNYYYLMSDVEYSGTDKITDRDMVIAYAAFKNDNPQYFWLDSVCQPDSENDLGERMYIYSYYSPDVTEKKIDEFENAVELFLESIPSNLSEPQLELYIHDYIYDLCIYDDPAAELEYGDKDFNAAHDSSNAYGVLVNGYAICQGYAEVYSYLLSLVGINSTTISSQDHIWNAVELDGDWYNVDLTWNDTTQSYLYFNITDKELSLDHETAPHYSELTDSEIVGTETEAGIWFNVYLPECTETTYSYANIKD